MLIGVYSIRQEPWQHKRMNREEHLCQLLHKGAFENEYLMSLPTYDKLLQLLSPILQRNQSNCHCDEPILPEHIFAYGLRILGGGRPKDQCHIIGTSPDATYKAFNFFLNSVSSLPDLEIKMPKSPEDWDSIYKSFKRKSTPEIMAGCVGCLDGFFQRSMRPSKTEVANDISYYSGHYESYGLNCQACVQCDLQFMYFGVVSPGSTNDNISYSQAFELRQILESLPSGLFILSDVIFTGVDRSDPAHDAFNYYLSNYISVSKWRLEDLLVSLGS